MRWGWVAIVVVILIFMPYKGEAQRIDPYSFYTLTGKVEFRYERQSTGTSRYRTKSSLFGQLYELGLKGNIWDPRFIIFDSSISLSDSEGGNGIETSAEILNYGLRTTFFPRFRFPLTLYGERGTGERSVGETTGDSTRDTYGMELVLRFRKPPRTRIKVEKTETRDIISLIDTERMLYYIDMTKDIGATKNRLDYNLTTLEDNIYNIKTELSALNFNNTIRLTRNSFINAGASRYTNRIEEPDRDIRDAETKSLHLGLTSRSTRRFNQSYQYRFTGREEDSDKDTRHHFLGMVNYAPTDRLSTSGNINFTLSEYESPTLTTESKSLSLGTAVGYRVTTTLSTFGSIGYSHSDTEKGEPLTGKTKRDRITVTTGLGYVKPLKWATLSTRYGVGYYEESVEPEGGGKGISHDFGAGLSNINLRYLTVSTNYNLHVVDSYTDNVDLREEIYNLSAEGKNLKYLTLSAYYTRYRLDHYEDILDKEEERIRLDAKSLYIRNTTLTASAEYQDIKMPTVEEYNSFRISFAGDHRRAFLRGLLTLSAGHDRSFTNYQTSNDSSRFIRTYYQAGYNRRLTRNLGGRFTIRRNESDTDGRSETNTIFDTRLEYRLKAWFITAQYYYSINEATGIGESLITDRLIIRVTRRFWRIF